MCSYFQGTLCSAGGGAVTYDGAETTDRCHRARDVAAADQGVLGHSRIGAPGSRMDVGNLLVQESQGAGMKRNHP